MPQPAPRSEVGPLGRGPGPAHPTVGDGVFSCVVDDHPRFHLDALRWYASLTTLAGVGPDALVVHAVGGTSSDALDRLRDFGVTVRDVEPFDARSPHCNKISGARALAEEGVTGVAVLCDTDVAVLEDPRALTIPDGSVAAKVVDAPVPPLDVVLAVFTEAGISPPDAVPLPWGPGDRTVTGNGNGGLYLVPGTVLGPVAEAWARWARWLLERSALLGEWGIYLDQVAMALALAAEGIGFHPLEPRWNTPTHDLERIPPDAGPPAVIHYHQEVGVDGRLRLTGTPAIDRQIERVNGAVAGLWQQAFPNGAFWQWRYLTDPDLGSGVGSRGRPLEDKRALLGGLCEALEPGSVLDVGCGDGEATRDLALPGYTGLDLSAEAVRRAALGRPGGTYLVGTLADHPVDADLVLCLDVLIHQPDVDTYRELVARLWASTRVALVVTGYQHPQSDEAPMVHFHEPLSVTLRAVAHGAESYPVRREHSITTWVVLRPPPRRHRRDYTGATLDALVEDHPDPVGLIAIRVCAWRTLGFYPDHEPRLWEYPTVAGLMRAHVDPGGRLLDIGAGVTPLVPYLGKVGFQVETVDPSPVVRQWPPADDWNEWDFLDYAAAGLARRSWNCTLDRLPAGPTFDGAYSVSVVEHLPAHDRRALVGEIAGRVKLGGLVVLTIDLVRDTDVLWNRSRGVEVEDPARHGTIGDVVVEAAERGLEVVRVDRVRHWGRAEVDIGLVVLRRSARRARWDRLARQGRQRIRPLARRGRRTIRRQAHAARARWRRVGRGRG